MWPSSAAPPVTPRTRLAVAHDAAADAGPDRQHHRVVAAERRAVAPLGEHRAVRVVVDGDRHAEPLLHQRLEGHALERQVRAGGDGAVPAVDDRRDAEGGAEHVVGAASAAARTVSASTSSSSVPCRVLRRALGAMVHREVHVHRAGKELRPPDVHPDDARAGHGRHHTRQMAADPPPPDPGGRPRHTASTARRRAGSRAARRRWTSCAPARRRPRPGRTGRRAGAAAAGRTRPPWRRILTGSALALAGWVALSVVLFLFSAQFLQDRVDGATKAELAAARRPVVAPTPSSILGSDQRIRGHEGARRQHLRPEPVGLDAAHAGRRRPQREALDPARHDRRDPRPRARTRSTPPTRSAGRRSPSRPSSSSSGSRSTT